LTAAIRAGELVAKKGLGLRQTTVLDAAWFDRFG